MSMFRSARLAGYSAALGLAASLGATPAPAQEAVWQEAATRAAGPLAVELAKAFPGIGRDGDGEGDYMRFVTALKAAGLVSNIRFTGYWDYVENNYPQFATEPKSPKIYHDPSYWVARHSEAVMTNWQTMTAARVAAYHQAGLDVLLTHNNNTNGWMHAIQLNFDGILVDKPNEAKAFCATVP